jgi:predicted O-linked N-acetylglucosamine transferase (SPINDLY family)
VALAGNVHAGRVGVSLMNNLGLAKLIGQTPEEYVAIASQLAADLEHLGTLRKELRARMMASPLTDAQGFTKNLERAYLGMWKDWCLDLPP